MQSLHQDTRKQKLLVPKLDYVYKHARKRKNEEGAKTMDLKCVQAKNETTYIYVIVSMNYPLIL
jgi:hypothetical protein